VHNSGREGLSYRDSVLRQFPTGPSPTDLTILAEVRCVGMVADTMRPALEVVWDAYRRNTLCAVGAPFDDRAGSLSSDAGNVATGSASICFAPYSCSWA
jgi:hypothetical protein